MEEGAGAAHGGRPGVASACARAHLSLALWDRTFLGPEPTAPARRWYDVIRRLLDSVFGPPPRVAPVVWETWTVVTVTAPAMPAGAQCQGRYSRGDRTYSILYERVDDGGGAPARDAWCDHARMTLTTWEVAGPPRRADQPARARISRVLNTLGAAALPWAVRGRP